MLAAEETVLKPAKGPLARELREDREQGKEGRGKAVWKHGVEEESRGMRNGDGDEQSRKGGYGGGWVT